MISRLRRALSLLRDGAVDWFVEKAGHSPVPLRTVCGAHRPAISEALADADSTRSHPFSPAYFTALKKTRGCPDCLAASVMES